MSTTSQQFELAQQAVLDHFDTDATSRHVRIADPPLDVHVLEVGQGRPVVMLHGGGGMAVQMEPLLGGLGEHFRVLAPDRPGCGLTDAFDYAGVDFRSHGVRFLESLLDALELDHASIVAGSIAGLWALAFAHDRPERTQRVVLVGSSAGLTSDAPIPLRLAGTPVIGHLLSVTVMRPSEANTRRQFEEFVVDTDGIPEEIITATHAATSLPGAHDSFTSMVRQVVTLRGFDPDALVVDYLPDIEAPVLFVWGSGDGVYPPSVGREAVARLPNARLEVIEGAGHFVWLDAPRRTSQLAIDFLRAD